MKASSTQVPNQGSPRIPVLLVDYKDYKFKDSDPKAVFEQQCSHGEKSAYQYFVDQSNGMFTPQFDVYGPFTLSNKRAYYGANDSDGYDVALGEMVAEGCIGLDGKIDYSKYDNDGDGYCDVLIVIYAGDGEASSYEDDCADSIWPCQWSLSSSDYGKNIKLDNTTISKFAVFNELYGADLSKIDGVGTFCHEFSHCLGLPDFYDTEYGNHFGMGSWSLMDYGSYNDNSFTPCGYTAYEKEFMGWISIDEAKANQFYTLPVFNAGAKDTDVAVKLTNDNNPNEYFVIENRKLQGWDRYMPTEGLLIYHVTYDATAWNTNVVNNYSVQRMTPVPADGELKFDKYTYYGDTYYQIDYENQKGDLWPYGNVNAFTDDSTPAAKLSYGGYLGKPVTEMKKNSDGTISFWTMKGARTQVGHPQNPVHQINTANEVMFSWEASSHPDVTYTLEVKEKVENEVKNLLSADFSHGNMNWDSDGYLIFEENEGAFRFSSNKQQGSIISPQFLIEEKGTLSVVVNAKYYNNDNSQLKVSLLDGSGNIQLSKTISLDSDYSDQVVQFANVKAGTAKVKVETVTTKKRFYLKKVDVYYGEYQKNVIIIKAADNKDYHLIEGITGLSHTLSGLKENGVYTYRVKAVPNDPDLYDESEWSPSQTVDLSESGFITKIDDMVEESHEVEYFTLQGLRISSITSPGVYIIKKGVKTEKVMVR